MSRSMIFVRFVLLGVVLAASAGCTTSKWTVISEDAVDSSEQPEVVQNSIELILEQEPSVEHPVLRLAPYNIVRREYAERVQIRRTVQEYKPKWGFALLTLAGSAISILAANTDYLLPSANTSQRVALNATGAMLVLLTATNLEERGDPIMTDEIRYLRQTGFDVRTDTLKLNSFSDAPASITVYNGDTVLLNEPTISFESGFVEINFGALSTNISDQITEEADFTVRANYRGVENIYSFPVTDFLEPYFVIRESIGQIRSAPSITRENIVAEIGKGSALPMVERRADRWIEVRYNNLNTFIEQSAGQVEWRSTAEDSPALLVEVADIPFGKIDVETSVPVLKSGNAADRAIVLSGYTENQAGVNQYSERDEQLFRHYMTTALRMGSEQVRTIGSPELSNWIYRLQSCEEMGGGALHVYLNGYARSYDSGSGSENLALFHVGSNGDVSSLPLMDLFEQLSECTAEKMFIYVNLQYVDELDEGQIISFMDSNGGKQQRLAYRLTRDFPNAFVLFGNRIGQNSSAYSGSPEDDKRHDIFTYFWAEAIQQRKTRMSDLLRYLENNVDYTSRRLHDEPQEVRGFGNFMLDLAE